MSSGDSSTTVLQLAIPLAPTAIPTAAAEMLSGTSQITYASVSPNAKSNDSTCPPMSDSIFSTASRRATPPLASTPFMPSDE
jgi:hypothetical protein